MIGIFAAVVIGLAVLLYFLKSRTRSRNAGFAENRARDEEVAYIEAPEVSEEIDSAGTEIPEASESEPISERQPAEPVTEKQEEVVEAPKWGGQISELDHRLDALEELVASIEQSLKAFEPDEETDAMPTEPARAA